jgi:UDP-N-acetylmuramate--alanine ligase
MRDASRNLQSDASRNIAALLHRIAIKLSPFEGGWVKLRSEQNHSREMRHVHLVGIGGIGLSAIARILLAQGNQVSGSDLKASSITEELAKQGAKIFIGHRAENIGSADLVLITSAVHENNPEVTEAKRRGLRVVKRYEFLPEITKDRKVIAIAGTHGKTTTTGMIANILVEAGLDPSVIVGGRFQQLDGNARAGTGEYFVIEADEYDRAFLGLHPHIAVVTAIEMDHPDIFVDVDQVARTFREFLSQVDRGGAVVACGDNEVVERELEIVECEVVRYGFGANSDYRGFNAKPNVEGGMDYQVSQKKDEVTNFTLRVPGKHNVLNSLAAVAVADRVGVDRETTRRVLQYFIAADRRFEVKGDFGGVTIVDDYAHHPTEIRATLASARDRYKGRAMWAVFQPHTYSLNEGFAHDLARAFQDADHVIVTDIFAAREQDDLSISSRDLVARMKHKDARFLAKLDEAVDYLARNLKPGDVLITLGAGDVNRVGELVGAGLVHRSR